MTRLSPPRPMSLVAIAVTLCSILRVTGSNDTAEATGIRESVSRDGERNDRQVKSGRDYSYSDGTKDYHQQYSITTASPSPLPYYNYHTDDEADNSAASYLRPSYAADQSFYYPNSGAGSEPNIPGVTVIKKKLPATSSYYPSYSYQGGYHYASPYETATLIECQENMMSSILGDALQSIGLVGIGKTSILKTLVSALVASLLAKIPLLLALKALVVKLVIVPIALVMLTAPIILPIFLLFMPFIARLKEAFLHAIGVTSTTPATSPMVMMMAAQSANATSQAAPAIGRSAWNDYSPNSADSFLLLLNIVNSEQCLEKLACQIGAEQTHTRSSLLFGEKSVSWLVNFLQNMNVTRSNFDLKVKLKKYKEAFIRGLHHARKDASSKQQRSQEDDACEQYKCVSVGDSQSAKTRLPR